MTVPSMFLPLDGDYEGQDRNGAFTATASGPQRFVDGPTTEYKVVRPFVVSNPALSEDEIGTYDPVINELVDVGDTWKIHHAKTPPASFLTNFDGNVTAKTQNGDVALTTNGPVRYEPSRPLGVEGENLTPNPQFDSGWVAQGGSVAQDTTVTKDGVSSGVHTRTATTEGYLLSSNSGVGTVIAGTILTQRVYLRSSVSGAQATVKTYYRDAAGVAITSHASPIVSVATAGWTEIVYTAPTAPANTSRMVQMIVLVSGTAPVGAKMWCVQPQVVRGSAIPYSYLDGSMGAGYWTDDNGVHHREAWALQEGVTEYRGVPATTNYVMNPQVKNDLYSLSTYTAAGGVPSVERVTDVAVGPTAVRISTDGTSTHQGGDFEISPDLKGTSFTAQCLITGNSPVTLAVIVRASDNTLLGTVSKDFIATSDPQILSVSFTLDDTSKAPTKTSFIIRNPTVAAVSYDVTNAQFEAGLVPTPLAVGSMDDHVWEGTPHASVSRRESWAYGGAYVAEEGTTNLMINPLLTNNDEDWAAWESTGSSAIFGRSTERPDISLWTWRTEIETLAMPSHSFLTYFYADTSLTGVVTPSAVVAASRERDISGAYTRLVYTDGTQTDTPLGDVRLSPEPTRVVWPTGTIDPTKTLERVYGMLSYGSDGSQEVGDVIWMGKAQIENKAYATSFCPEFKDDGTLKEGYAWTGTPHASTSTRVSSHTSCSSSPVFNAESGSFMIRAKRDADNSTIQRVIQAGNDGVDGLLLRKTGDNWQLYIYNNTVYALYQAASTSSGEYDTVYVEWNNGTACISVNNAPPVYENAFMKAPIGKNLVIGAGSNTSYQPFNGTIDDIVFFPRPLTDTERNYIFSADTWEWDNVRHVDGKIEIGLQETINLVPNPRMKNTVTNNGWEIQSATREHMTNEVIPQLPNVTTAVKLTADASTISTIFFTTNSAADAERLSVVPNKAYTFSAYLRSEAAGRQAKLRIIYRNASNGNVLVGNFEIGTVTNEYQRFSTTLHAPSDAYFAYVLIYMRDSSGGNDFAVGESLFATAFQFEQSSYPTAYVDGDMLDAEWTGTPHLSTSIRTARADAGNTKSALVRYQENNTTITQLIRHTANIGAKGRARFKGGTLYLEPIVWNDTFEVEDVALFDVDVEDVQPRLEAVDNWTRNALLIGLDVPIPAALIEEGTTNYTPNPLAENSTEGWATSGSRQVRVADVPLPLNINDFHVSKCFYGFNPDDLSGLSFNHMYFMKPVEVPMSTDCTYSAYVYVPSSWSGGALELAVYSANVTGSFLADVDMSLVDTWQRVVVGPFQFTDTYGQQLQLRMKNNDGGLWKAQEHVFLAAPQLEVKPYATSFCPQFDPYQNLLEGYSWSGTPHASSSVREGSILYFPANSILNSNRGSVVMNIKNGGDGHVNRYALRWGNYGSQDFISIQMANDRPRGFFHTTYGSPTTVEPNVTIPDGEWFKMYLEWDGEHIGASVNDGPLITGSRTVPSGVVNSSVAIGAYTDNYQTANNSYGDMLCFDRPLNETDRTTLFEAETWEWNTLFQTLGGIVRQESESPIVVSRETTDLPIAVSRISNT